LISIVEYSLLLFFLLQLNILFGVVLNPNSIKNICKQGMFDLAIHWRRWAQRWANINFHKPRL